MLDQPAESGGAGRRTVAKEYASKKKVPPQVKKTSLRQRKDGPPCRKIHQVSEVGWFVRRSLVVTGGSGEKRLQAWGSFLLSREKKAIFAIRRKGFVIWGEKERHAGQSCFCTS